jgi:hypothetical protein
MGWITGRNYGKNRGEQKRKNGPVIGGREELRVCCGMEARLVRGSVLLAVRVVVALYDGLCAHDEPHTPDRQWRTLSTMTYPPRPG